MNNLYIDIGDGVLVEVHRLKTEDLLHVAVDEARYSRESVIARFPKELRERVVVTHVGENGTTTSVEPRESFSTRAELHEARAENTELIELNRDLIDRINGLMAELEEVKNDVPSEQTAAVPPPQKVSSLRQSMLEEDATASTSVAAPTLPDAADPPSVTEPVVDSEPLAAPTRPIFSPRK